MATTAIPTAITMPRVLIVAFACPINPFPRHGCLDSGLVRIYLARELDCIWGDRLKLKAMVLRSVMAMVIKMLIDVMERVMVVLRAMVVTLVVAMWIAMATLTTTMMMATTTTKSSRGDVPLQLGAIVLAVGIYC